MQEDLLPVISLTHFQRIMGPYGLYQHATYDQPNLAEGYCVDDNARAVIVLLDWMGQFPHDAATITPLLDACFSYLRDARHASGVYYNFRDAEGQWLTHDVSEDMYARLARAYAYVLAHDSDETHRQTADELFIDLIPTLQKFTKPRAQAEAMIAVAALPQAFLASHSTALEELVRSHLKHLLALWNRESSADWPWFEPAMTYANAIIPHGILAGLAVLRDAPAGVSECLAKSTDFLLRTTIQKGMFTPVGSAGWYPKGGKPAVENQQAIEAGTMLDFLLAYHQAFPAKVSEETLAAPYLWFFGANTHHMVMADAATGTCHDALFTNGPNQNFGAESTLAYLSAELLLRRTPTAMQKQVQKFFNA